MAKNRVDITQFQHVIISIFIYSFTNTGETPPCGHLIFTKFLVFSISIRVKTCFKNVLYLLIHASCLVRKYYIYIYIYFRYVIENKLSQNSRVRNTLKDELKKVELLQDNIIVPYEHLQQTSSNLEATKITESLQYRERGLLHINDASFNFFLALEQERVGRINKDKLREYKSNFVDQALKEVWNHEVLQQMFVNLFNAPESLVSNT